MTNAKLTAAQAEALVYLLAASKELMKLLQNSTDYARACHSVAGLAMADARWRLAVMAADPEFPTRRAPKEKPE